ncbi:MAG TPA: hypothetical protein VF844_00170 [Ktedonobacteraceae bacterium]
MRQVFVSHCDCCGLSVDPQTTENCPRCHYPVNPDKEEHFLESAINDLQRVAKYGGGNMRVDDLRRRYQVRLDAVRHFKALIAPTTSPIPVTARAPAAPIAAQPPIPQVLEEAKIAPAAIIPPVLPGEERVVAALPPARPQPPRRVFSWSSFFADQAINIVASVGAFLLLIGSLSFTITTSNLFVSFLVVFAVHAVFGITGFVTYRFQTFRIVATIYTIIFALLIPLVGFSAYRLLSGSHIEFSIPVLIAISATYAAIMYALMAIYQRFIPFAYLSLVALLVADLAVADALNLAWWWWPSMAMVQAILSTISLKRPNGSPWPFRDRLAVLRDPMRYVMYAIVAASLLGLFYALSYSLSIDSSGSPIRQLRFSILSVSVLLLLWATLTTWLAKWARAVLVLAYIALGAVLALCYAFDFEPIGYALALTCVALLYHGLNRVAGRRLLPFGVLSLGLDHITLALVFVVPLICSPLLPLQLFAAAYVPSLDSMSSLPFETSWRTVAELIAVGLGIVLAVSVTFYRAGSGKTPAKAGWCWLLLLGGFLLHWEYSIVVLAFGVEPVWAFLGLALVILAGAVVVRRLFGVAWANPLDVLALFGMALTLGLSLNQNQDIISALLLSFAALLYVVLLYQRRQNWLFLPLIFALSALPTLWDRPLAMLLIGVLLPLASVAIHQFISNRWNVAHTGARTGLSLAHMWEWPLLAAGLVYGAGASIQNVTYDIGAMQSTFGVHVPIAVEIALLSVSWYASAALARMKVWLVPSVGFAIGALLISNNSFWVLFSLTPVLAILGVGTSRFAGRDWALPLYITAMLSAVMTGYTGSIQGHLLATSWALLGFAALAYIIGVIEKIQISMWIMPVFTTWSVIVSAGPLGDLYRPPTVALICAALGASVGFLKLTPLPFFGPVRKNKFLAYVLPFYATAFAAAILTGIYGTLANINKPFYGAVPDALLVYAVVAFALLVFERQPVWLWLVAGFAIWGTLLTLQLTAYYVLGTGVAMALAGLITGFIAKRFASKTSPAKSKRPLQQFTWSSPWYVTAVVAAVLIGLWTSLPLAQPTTGFIGYSMLALTAIAVVIMLVERIPELVVFPAGLAAGTIWLWVKPPLDPVPLMIAYSLLCLVIFAMQFTWRIIPPASRWLPAAIPHVILGLGGQILVVLVIIAQGGLSADSGQLVHVGAGSLLELAILLFWYGSLHTGIIARENASIDGESRLKSLQQAKALQHWCYYAAGLLLSLVVSWELSAFGQTRLDELLLAPASYLSVVAAFLMRDETLQGRHWVGQIIALAGAALLLLPALWFSFGDSNLTPTLVLIGESLALLLLGIATRLRIFILSSAALLVVGTLRALFLSTPPSLALMVLGVMLVMIATALFLVRHKLKVAWMQWE